MGEKISGSSEHLEGNGLDESNLLEGRIAEVEAKLARLRIEKNELQMKGDSWHNFERRSVALDREIADLEEERRRLAKGQS